MAGGMPYDRKRTIADIIAKLSTFKDWVRWNLTRDYKPRYLLGCKSDGTPIDIHDSDGYPQFQERGSRRPSTQTSQPATNADSSITISQTRVELLQIHVACNCAVNVSDRALKASIVKTAPGTPPITLTGATKNYECTGITLSSDQNGQITIPPNGKSIMTNDNGTSAVVADENPLPMILDAGDTVQATYDNKHADDRAVLKIEYRVLED